MKGWGEGFQRGLLLLVGGSKCIFCPSPKFEATSDEYFRGNNRNHYKGRTLSSSHWTSCRHLYVGGHHLTPLHKIMASRNVEMKVHRKWCCSNKYQRVCPELSSPFFLLWYADALLHVILTVYVYIFITYRTNNSLLRIGEVKRFTSLDFRTFLSS